MTDSLTIVALKRTFKGFETTLTNIPEPVLLSVESVAKYGLRKGETIDRPLLDQIVRESCRQICQTVATRLLGYRDHAEGELRQKLKLRNHDPDDIKFVIEKFKESGLIDDLRFATNLARRTLERKPAGRSFLVATLQKKMISRDIAGKVIDDLLAGSDQVDLAKAALQPKLSRYRQLNLETARTKAYNYLSRRGISYAAAKAAFEQLCSQADEENED